jgi:steroid delta-isomerase-like uncharacterized protein
MASKNVETFMKAHKAFNERDFDAAADAFRDDAVYWDTSRNVQFRGKKEFIEFMRGWTSVLSNAEVHEPKYIDGGDTVIAQFIGRGVNDGSIGPLPPSGKELTLPFCEIMHFDKNGKVVRAEMYYDQLSMLTQLGHIKAPG